MEWTFPDHMLNTLNYQRQWLKSALNRNWLMLIEGISFQDSVRVALSFLVIGKIHLIMLNASTCLISLPSKQ